MAPTLQKRIHSSVGISHDNDVVVKDNSGVLHYVPRGPDVNRIVQITQAAYDLLSPPDANTLYLITD